MGRELLCKVRSGGKEASGKALLETSEVIFRGDMRLKIPFVSLKSVVARDGELHLKWPEGSAVFEVGDHAEKWAHKILHPKSTAEKLGIKPGLTISALAIADGNFIKDLRADGGVILRYEGAEQFGPDLSRRAKRPPNSLTPESWLPRWPARVHCGSSIPKANRRLRNCR